MSQKFDVYIDYDWTRFFVDFYVDSSFNINVLYILETQKSILKCHNHSHVI